MEAMIFLHFITIHLHFSKTKNDQTISSYNRSFQNSILIFIKLFIFERFLETKNN